MIASLVGTVVHKDDDGAILECHGVGYGVSMTAPTLAALGAIGNEARLFVYTHVAEDALKLYGFVNADERRTFEILLSTSGVGPRLALAILAVLPPKELVRAVTLKDRSAFTRVGGVGPKKADRLMLELDGRLPFVGQQGVRGNLGGAQLVTDVASALTHLGFAVAQATEAARAAQEALPECVDVVSLTRHALQKISHDKKTH